MSDLFHEKVPFAYVRQVFDVISLAHQHTFQVLTKRPERMAEFCGEVAVPDNVWLGVSVEDRKYGLPRIPILRSIKARTRFLSVEPLLEDLGQIDVRGIQWVIVGGESGRRARQMKSLWVDSIKRQCDASGAAFFFKQWGAWGSDGEKRSKSANGREYHGRIWDAMPLTA
jgi:protein gp37